MIPIYIPTRGRPYNQETLKWFPKEMQTNGQVVLVIDSDEEEKYYNYKDTPKMVVPEDCIGIGPKRKYIVENKIRTRSCFYSCSITRLSQPIRNCE